MKYDPEIHHRHSVRMKEYDYSQPGDYLVTVCTKQNVHLMGEFKDSSLVLNKYGVIIETWLKNITAKYSNVRIDKYVLMPNHVHAIISIRGKSDSRCEGLSQKSKKLFIGHVERSETSIFSNDL